MPDRAGLAALLPAAVAVEEARGELTASDERTPYLVEAAAIAQAVARRRREFLAVRRCARQAMAGLGLGPTAIVPGERGAPTWPPGVVGSMTHCPGYRAAAVARAGAIRGLGIDAETHEPLPEGVLRVVSLPEERTHLAGLARERPDVAWDRVLFSVKETVYKAWFPLTGRWLGFEEAVLRLDPAGGWTARLLVPGPPELTRLRGGWLVADGLVLTAVAVAAGTGEHG